MICRGQMRWREGPFIMEHLHEMMMQDIPPPPHPPIIQDGIHQLDRNTASHFMFINL